MGKRRRRRGGWWRGTTGGVTNWIAVTILGGMVVAVVVIAAVAVQTPDVSPEVAAARDRINAESAQRAADEAAEREAALEAKRTRVPIPADHPLRVLVIGDSLSAGSYVTDPALSWPNLVNAHVAATTPSELTVEAVAGQRTRAAAERGVGAAGQDLVVVELGTNDVGNTEVEWFRAHYQALLDDIRATSPSAAIVCLTPWQTRERAAEYTTVITELCGKSTDISTLYTQSGMRILNNQPWYGGVTPDNFHPGDQGHAAIAKAVTAWLVVG